MSNNRVETSFERMKKAVCERVREDIGVEVTAVNSHTSCTLKVVAIPEKVNTVEVFVPNQIFVGAKTSDVCEFWDLDYWKEALKHLCLEFGVRGGTRTRLMTKRAPGVSPRMYANVFWTRMEEMKKWNIEVPEIPKAKPVGAELLKTVAQLSADDAIEKPETVHALERMGLRCCRK